MTTSEREQIITQILEDLTPNIRKMAYAWSLSFDDLYQDACLIIIRVVDSSRVAVADLPRFTNRCVRNGLLNKARYLRRRESFSLDEPLTSESEVTFADLLPSPYHTEPEFVLLAKERLEDLKISVERLSGQHGIAVRSRYETALATYC